MSKPHLSPLDVHLRLMQRARQALRYSGGDVKRWQSALRRKLAQLSGYDLLAAQARPVLRVRSLWRKDDFRGLGSVEKILFTSEPGADVPACVCLPQGVPPPYTWLICLQGHSTGMHVSLALAREDEETRITSAGDRDFAVRCLQEGCAALCLEQRAFGERRENLQALPGPDVNCQTPAMRALLLGRTLLAERVYDVDRALDYLATRRDVAPGRVGIMGQSGGGTVSVYAGALLPRLAFMMPACAFCTLSDSIMRIRHCTDNYVPGLYNWAEMADVLGLFAPRPVVVVAGEKDPIFPVRGVRRAFAALRRIYRAAGAAERCRLVVGPEGHRFYADPAWRELKAQLAAGAGRARDEG